jgi:hypothetical protein
VHNFESLSNNLLDSPVVLLAERTVLHLPASILDDLPNLLFFNRVLPASQLLGVLGSVVFIQQNSTTALADGLENVDDMFEVSLMIDRQLKIDIAKMTRTHYQIFATSLTSSSFLTNTLLDTKLTRYQIKLTSLRSSGPFFMGWM